MSRDPAISRLGPNDAADGWAWSLRERAKCAANTEWRLKRAAAMLPQRATMDDVRAAYLELGEELPCEHRCNLCEASSSVVIEVDTRHGEVAFCPDCVRRMAALVEAP